VASQHNSTSVIPYKNKWELYTFIPTASSVLRQGIHQSTINAKDNVSVVEIMYHAV
jgi:hypothetical protein